MNSKPEFEETSHDELIEFEKELEAVLALDPIERIQRYESLNTHLIHEMETAQEPAEPDE